MTFLMNTYNIWFRGEIRNMRVEKKSEGNILKHSYFFPENDNSFKLSFYLFIYFLLCPSSARRVSLRAEGGLLKEVGAGYTFFWSGRKKEEQREAGVGFATKSHLVSKLSGLPKGVNDSFDDAETSLIS